MVAAPALPTGARRTRAQRLEAFYQKSLAAASPRSARKMRATMDKAKPKGTRLTQTMVNLQFLQSGHEFSQLQQQSQEAAVGAKRSKAQRLEAFYLRSLAAASPRVVRKASLNASEPRYLPLARGYTAVSVPRLLQVPSIVNVKFLSQGGSYYPAGVDADDSRVPKEERASDLAPKKQPRSGAKRTRAQRLNEFYQKTLAAAAPQPKQSVC